MAIEFATSQPTVTSAIIGPRTMEHLDAYLAADGVNLSGDLLDRIDQIVPRSDGQRRPQRVGYRHDGPECRIPPAAGR
jgi:aryl-alcohol dehydrogenase-like predicted oxidoreductase